MRIKQIKIENFFQHGDLDIPIHPGATAVLAPNGSGKSNLIRSIYAALTGEILGGGDLESALKWGAYKGEVRLSFEHMGEQGCVSRTLKGTPSPEGRAVNVKCKHSLKCGDVELIKKNEINDWLSQAIGVEVKALRELAFPRQGQLDRLFTCEHADRASILAEMLGLKSAEKIRAALSDVKSRMWSIPCDEADVQRQRDALAEARKASGRYVGEIEEIREAMKGLDAFVPALKAALTLQTTEEKEKALSLRRATAEHNQTLLQRLAGEIRDMGARPAPVTQAERDAAYKARDASEALKGWETLKESLPRLRAANPLAPRTLQKDTMEAKVRLQDLRDKLERSKDEKNLLLEGRCPTCGHEFKDAEAGVERLEAQCAALVNEIFQTERDYRALSKTLAEHTAAKKAWLHDIQVFRNEYRALKHRMASGDPSLDWESARDRDHNLAAWDAANAKMSAKRVELARLQERQLSLNAEIERFEAQESVPAKDKEDARKVMEQYENMQNLLAEAGKNLSMAEAAIKVRQEELERGEAALARAKRLKAGAELMDKATQAFRPDGLPRMVISSSISALNAGIAEAMTGFGAPFELTLDQDLDFIATFPEGPASAAVLSGGQMTMAAIAFRFAMLDMRASGCGIMALDEPTAFVDGANKQALIELLTRMDGFLTSAGMAALVPTHDEELAGACSRVIRLDE